MLQGDNAYHCDKCDKKVTTLKRVCIKRLPRYLIFVLKRFDINYDNMQKFKINDYCEFPSLLNMKPFTTEGLAEKDKEKELEKAKKEGKDLDELQETLPKIVLYPDEYYQYKLSGIVIHLGTADAGHYYSLIMDREKENIPENKRWFEFNDNIVDFYNPEDIKNDAIGGEERIQHFDGMAFRAMEKSRNAYLLVEDRIAPYEPPEDNPEESDENNKKLIHISSTSVISIPAQIHSLIMQENIKYWYSRYVFHPHYFHFALNLCTNWNTKECILSISPCKNNDYELLEFDKKIMLLHAFQEPKSELPICTDNGNKVMEIQVFKYVTTLVLTTLLRVREKCYVVEFINLIKAHINKNEESAKWILWQFCNSKIIFEFLLECNDGYMRRLVVGILYCAMLKVYKTEKLRLFAPAEGDVLINFTNGILDRKSVV